MSDKAKAWSVVGGIVAALLLILLLASTCWGVPAGHVGVVSSFGEVSDTTLPPGGPYLVKPWKSIKNIQVQTQKDEQPTTVPCRNGLAVQMKAVIIYHLDPNKAPAMLRDVGEKYNETLVDPYFKNVVKDVCAEHDPEALYTAERQAVEGEILIRVQKVLGDRGIIVEQTMIQDPILPDVVVSRIQAKVGAEQDVQRMTYVLKQKKLEADAKVVEARGIAEAQTIIKKDLDDNYLRFMWIMALKEHSGSIIYVPTGSDGLPFFNPVHPGHK